MLRSCNNKPWFARCVNRRYNKRKLVPEHKLQPHPRSQRSNVELPPPPRCFLEKKLLPRTTRRKIVPLSFGCSLFHWPICTDESSLPFYIALRTTRWLKIVGINRIVYIYIYHEKYKTRNEIEKKERNCVIFLANLLLARR